MDQNKRGVRLWSVLFWLAIWQLASMVVGKEILLVSPLRTIVRLGELCMEAFFWRAVGYTMARILLGFLLATAAGLTLAALAGRFKVVRELLTPFMLTVKAIPVASFIIVALIWFSSKRLSVLISFLMVLPIVYTNLLDGMDSIDGKLKQMARVFRLSPLRRAAYVAAPQLLPFFRAACSLGLGLAWKSGIAAEVIGIPAGSIGERLQRAKVYLETPDLFAWTLTIVLLSTACERIALRLLKRRVPLKLRRSCASIRRREKDIAPPAFSAVGLEKSFDGKRVLDGLTLHVAAGEAVCLMAPSGAGKTTLINILLGLLPADEGNVEGLKGVSIGAVFQEDRLIEDMDAADNILMTNRRVSREDAERELRLMGLEGCAGQPVSSLSGGMRRRVCLLRALMSESGALILDEPFTGLDERTRTETIARVRALRAGRTTLLVTHDPEAARLMEARVIEW